MSSLKVPGEPNRPSITPAMIGAALLAGVPVIANLLHVFGVYTLSAEQQDALTSTMQWALGGAGVLAGADAYLRGKRNEAHAHVASSANHAAPPLDPEPAEPDFDPDVDPEIDDAELLDLTAKSFVADPRDRKGGAADRAKG